MYIADIWNNKMVCCCYNKYITTHMDYSICYTSGKNERNTKLDKMHMGFSINGNTNTNNFFFHFIYGK